MKRRASCPSVPPSGLSPDLSSLSKDKDVLSPTSPQTVSLHQAAKSDAATPASPTSPLSPKETWTKNAMADLLDDSEGNAPSRWGAVRASVQGRRPSFIGRRPSLAALPAKVLTDAEQVAIDEAEAAEEQLAAKVLAVRDKQQVALAQVKLPAAKAQLRRGSMFASVGQVDSGSTSPASPHSPTSPFARAPSKPGIHEPLRYKTSDGQSTFHEESLIGERVKRLTEGEVFGERALINEKTRATTVKCMTSCEFVVIDVAAYEQVLRARAKKVQFFEEMVHGCDGNACFFFEKATFSKGHILLDEGIITEPRIYIVEKGCVEFHRCEGEWVDPAKEYQTTTQARSRSRLRSSRPALQYDSVTEGGMFGSLSALQLCNTFEPFSAVVSSEECVVHYTTSGSIQLMSPELMKPMRDMMMRGLITRVLRLRERIPEAFAPAAPPRSEDDLKAEAIKKQNRIRRLAVSRAPRGLDPNWFPSTRYPAKKYCPEFLE